MNQDLQLKLQAHLDGELPPEEARAMVELIARDAQARDLVTELTHTRDAFVSHEADIKVPATREFYWSQIQREIQRQEKAPAVRPPEASLFMALRRLLAPASGLAAVVLAIALAGYQFRTQENVVVEETETTLEDAGAFTYRDYNSGTTLVWVDYPAEKGFADMNLDDILELD
jgi:anti-sigma factor RsiW